MDWKMLTLPGDRVVNEDSVRGIEHGRNQCFIVADGLGGHGKGDVASRLAVQAFDEVFRDETKSLPELLSDAFGPHRPESWRNSGGRDARSR